MSGCDYILVASLLSHRERCPATDWKLGAPVPEVPIEDPASAFGKGYSESKWVSEHLLENVTRERGARTIVVRVGQIEGDRTGHWNEREWFPSLVKSALFQKCLPQHDGVRISIAFCARTQITDWNCNPCRK